MALRINHNISSINTHRQLLKNDKNLSNSLEKLSSGYRINRGADGPAALVVSEQQRGQIAGLQQAIDNSENAVSLVQTAEGALQEVNSLLTSMRQLAIHAANEGANDEVMLNADQQEIANALDTINRISQESQFGTIKLLNGSNNSNGMTTGDNLEFISATKDTVTTEKTIFEGKAGTVLSTEDEGYDIVISRAASKTRFDSGQLTQAMVNNRDQASGKHLGVTLTVYEGGKEASYTTTEVDTVETAIENLRNEVNKQGLQVDIADDQGKMSITSKSFGDDTTFQVQSSIGGVFSEVGKAGEINEAITGADVQGTINGEVASGEGQFLTGVKGSKNIDGLKVKYTGTEEDLAKNPLQGTGPRGESAHNTGKVHVKNNALKFHVGANRDQNVGLSLMNTSADALATGIENASGFESLEEIDVRTTMGSQDAITMIDKAIESVSAHRAEIGAFQKNTLESNINNLRVAHENMTASESAIRDTDVAAEMATFTKNQIMTNAANSMLAQSNQLPNNVLRLLG